MTAIFWLIGITLSIYLAVDMDLKALYYEKDDFLDELSKQSSEPENGETIIKLD